MRKYRTLTVVNIMPESIGLDSRQAEKRMHLLKAGKDEGVFVPLSPLCFKAGEVISLPSVEKEMASRFEEVTEKKAKK